MAPEIQAAPSRRGFPSSEASGFFLAGIVASVGRDTQAAAFYFNEALKIDAKSAELRDQALVAALLDGQIESAFSLAEQILKHDHENMLARVVLGVRAIQRSNFKQARQIFDAAGRNQNDADLTILLLRIWAMVGAGRVDGAIHELQKFKDAELNGYRDFFMGLIADSAKREAEAERKLEQAHKAEPGASRVLDAYLRILSRRGKTAQALELVKNWKKLNPNQSYFNQTELALAAGQPLPPLVGEAKQGVAEVFYSLGVLSSAGREPVIGMVYLQLAHFLAPQDDVILMTLSEYFEQIQQFERSTQMYEKISPSSVFATRAAIARATNLEKLERTEEALTILKQLFESHPDNLEVADTLGTILRIKKRWEESIAVYDTVIERIPTLEYKHWVLIFGRAIGYERAKQWPKAEADFLKLLDLIPRRPRNPREQVERAQVLNYLAYSWVDMHLNIDRSFEMLREAVALTPTDGAIIDSLGWAYYRLGQYAEAVRELERAVLLKAGDATINDHLGDAYWQVGRQREARFKWRQSLELSPEPDEALKIKHKLAEGLGQTTKKEEASSPPDFSKRPPASPPDFSKLPPPPEVRFNPFEPSRPLNSFE